MASAIEIATAIKKNFGNKVSLVINPIKDKRTAYSLEISCEPGLNVEISAFLKGYKEAKKPPLFQVQKNEWLFIKKVGF
jgi:hypothetical protein